MADTSSQVLLVDDDPNVLRAMTAALASHASLRFATSGEDGLRLARQARPDLIVLDIEMPGMGGFAFCDALKADPLLASIPVIFVTSHTTSLIEVAALSHGAVDFVAKPVVASQLAARVRAHLRTQRLCRGRMLAGPVPAHPTTTTGRARPAVLIVDPDPDVLAVLRQSLSGLGDVHAATRGTEALVLAGRLRPDLVVLEAALPDQDGFELFAQLKALTPLRHVPVVFIHKSSDPSIEMRALDLGAVDFIRKPFARTVLHARLRNLLLAKIRNDERLHELDERWRQIGDARIAAMVGAASDAILGHDADGQIVLANAAAARLLGVSSDRLVGSGVVSVLGAELPPPVPGGEAPHRLVLTRGNGERFPVEITSSRSGAASLALTTVVLRDVSERELLEAERRRRADAETRSQATERMLCFIAHEMGNPLNALLGFAQMMACDSAHPLGDAQASRLKHILDGGGRLQALLADLADLRRIPGAPFSLRVQALDAAAATKSAIASMAALAARAGVSVTCRADLPARSVAADPQRLHQCLLNLLTNAVKYNAAGGSVVVDVAEVAGGVAISIRDNGPGMDAAQRERLFEPFDRLGRETESIPGMGLGLVITRRLVQSMHGRLEVESAPGQGSCFTIRLPTASTPLEIFPAAADEMA